MKGQFHRWYEPALRHARERAELERQATQLIKAADRRQHKRAPPRDRVRAPAPVLPQKLTLTDLATLRRLGRVP
jgi:hypothetical protein